LNKGLKNSVTAREKLGIYVEQQQGRWSGCKCSFGMMIKLLRIVVIYI
jgi:hypothetical protein